MKSELELVKKKELELAEKKQHENLTFGEE